MIETELIVHEMQEKVKVYLDARDLISVAKLEGMPEWDGRWDSNDPLDLFMVTAGCGGFGCTMDRMECWAAVRFLHDLHGMENGD